MRPTYADGGFLHLLDPNTTNNFAAYGATDERRIYFRIRNTNERVYIGFGRYKTTNMGNNANISPPNEALPLPAAANAPARELRFRILDPTGAVVLPEQAVPVSGVGFIGEENLAAYNRCVAGPAQLVGAGGYHALMFTPNMTGDFRIEFETYDIATNTVVAPAGARKALLQLFDLTVATGVGGFTVTQTGGDVNTGVVTSVAGGVTATAIPGRLWSRAWCWNTGDGNVPYNGRAYPYSDDGVVTEINFNGMRPFGFVVSCNRDGIATLPAAPANNFIVNRRSRWGLNAPVALHSPLYRIFLQDPDVNEFPNGTIGCLFTASVVQCDQNSPYCINVVAQANGEVEVIIDLHPSIPDGVFTPGTRDVRLTTQFNAPGAPETKCVAWDGLDGLGVQVPDGDISIIVNFQAGRTNLPIYDIEDHPNGFVVRLVRPLTNACGNPVAPPRLYWDDTNGTLNMPTGTALDGHINLAGCTSSPVPPAYPAPIPAGTIGCHRFTGRGANGNSETINTWWYVAEDKITIPFFNDNSLFDISGLFPGADPCVFTNGEFMDVNIVYSDAKFSLPALSFTITPTLPNYSFANPITDTPVVANAAANAPNGPQVVGNILLGGTPAKRQVTLRYKVVTSGTLNDMGYNFTVSTNACGSAQSSTASILCSELMPVELADFRGVNKGRVNLISWTTASERDNKGFGLERSPDGVVFREIAFIAGAGNSNRLQRYGYEDVLEVPQTFYYRLRQVDYDGTASYSKMIAITVNATDTRLTEIYHDGSSAEIAIRTNFDKPDNAFVTIYSLTGAVVSHQSLEIPIGNHIQRLALPRAAKGVYVVEVRTSGGISKRHKIVY
ncbi:T9SS type A sorting domain-containing protein [Rhodoflexus sp.]